MSDDFAKLRGNRCCDDGVALAHAAGFGKKIDQQGPKLIAADELPLPIAVFSCSAEAIAVGIGGNE